MSDGRRILTVTQVNEYMKLLVDANPQLTQVFVRGEISNFTNHYKTGHLYFTLKDGTGLLKTVMFRSYAQSLRFAPESGMKVVVRGRISVFVRDGQYQLYAEDMEPDGVGALYIAFEQLKARLEAEGLFAESRKRPLPPMPARIGLITSPTGAAVRDMINILGRRFPLAQVVLYGATVQGETAPGQLIAGLALFNRLKNVDLIIIGRGGGSIEDLWAFNDERLARAVAASELPVISAVGHETDFTICDFVADRRAPTPSAAAELAVPDAAELRGRLAAAASHMYLLTAGRVEAGRERVRRLAATRALTSPGALLDDRRMAVLSLAARMESAAKLAESRGRTSLAGAAAKLGAFDPLAVISRGYGAVYRPDGGLVHSVAQLAPGDGVTIRLADGTADAQILRTEINQGGRADGTKRKERKTRADL